MRVDIHQHLWTEPLLARLACRQQPPFIRTRDGVTELHCAAELPSLLPDFARDSQARREALQRDGIDLGVIALSSPLGIEALPRAEAVELIDAHLAGVEGAGAGFAAWGPVPLDGMGPEDVDSVLERGAVGISLPAGALSSVAALRGLQPVLARTVQHGVPLLVHPGPGLDPVLREPAAGEPEWWPALTDYVAQMQAAWLAFVSAGRREHPGLSVVFAMLAGGAPLLSDRVALRGGPSVDLRDARIFYDSSGFGPTAVEAVAHRVGWAQVVYGSDRPVVEPAATELDAELQRAGARLLPVSRAPA